MWKSITATSVLGRLTCAAPLTISLLMHGLMPVLPPPSQLQHTSPLSHSSHTCPGPLPVQIYRNKATLSGLQSRPETVLLVTDVHLWPPLSHFTA